MSICVLNNHRTKVVRDVYIKYDVNHIADKKVFFLKSYISLAYQNHV